MQLPATKKRRVPIWLDQDTVDRMMVHGKRGHYKLATIATILSVEGLDARDLLEAARKEREVPRG
jgi:hypothetical protein